MAQLMKKNGASFQAVTGAQAHILDMHAKAAQAIKADADAAKTQFDTENEKNQHLIAGLDNVLSLPPDQQAAALEKEKQLAISNNWLDPQHAQAITYQSPEQLLSLKKTLQGQAAFTAEQSKNAETEKAKQDAALAQMKANQLKQQESSGGAVGTGLDVQEANAWLKKNPGKDLADFQKYKATLVPAFNFNLQGGATGGLTQSALDQQAEKYFQTGQLPPIGRGGAGQALVHNIINRANQLHPGESLAEGSAEYAANKKSLENLQKNFDQVQAFENTAIKNIDQVIQVARTIPDLGTRFANIPIRKISGAMIGDENMAKLKTALATAQAESAKVLTSTNASGVLSDSARDEAKDFLDGNLPFKSMLAQANQLKTDFGNRHQSYSAQIADIQGRMKGQPGGSSTTPSTTEHKPGGQATGLREGQTGTGSDGKKYIVKGGVWQPQ